MYKSTYDVFLQVYLKIKQNFFFIQSQFRSWHFYAGRIRKNELSNRPQVSMVYRLLFGFLAHQKEHEFHKYFHRQPSELLWCLNSVDGYFTSPYVK